MEFTASKKEIRRRKRAFATLLASTLVGLVLASKILHCPISGTGYLLVAGLFFMVSVLTFQFLNSVSKTRLCISDEKIERMNASSSENLLFSDISRIKIKRRANGAIREIYIWFNDGKRLFLAAFEENFENIKNIIADKTDKNVAFKEVHEPIDFDHPLFYSLLGLPISFFSIYLFKLISGANSSQVKIIMSVFSVFVFSLGAYFILKKPISARYEEKRAVIDYIIGIFMVCAGVFMLFVGLNF